MDETERRDVRFCGVCERSVYFAATKERWDELKTMGKCVAVRRFDMESQRTMTTAGIPAFDPVEDQKMREKDRKMREEYFNKCKNCGTDIAKIDRLCRRCGAAM